MLKEHRVSDSEQGELMNKRDEWITRAVHVLRKVEFGGTELDISETWEYNRNWR